MEMVMSVPRSITFCAVVLILVQTTGCASFHTLQSPLPSTREEGRDVGADIRVTKHDGKEIRLAGAWMDRTHIGGITRGSRREYLEIPLTEVVAVEEKYTNVPRTITVLGVVLYLGYAAVVSYAMSG
jgi:hypothetical protein